MGTDGFGLGCVFRMVPVLYTHELQLTWQLPCQANKYLTKPAQYVAHLLGHESAGSILSEAKHLGWATELIAGTSEDDGFSHNTSCTMFNVTICLTKNGLKDWEFVVSMVMEYIGLLLREGPQKWIFDEMQAANDMQFQFQEEPDYDLLAQRLVSRMLPQSGLKQEHILAGPYLLYEWDPDAVQEVLQALSPRKCRVDLISSSFRDHVEGEVRDILVFSKLNKTLYPYHLIKHRFCTYPQLSNHPTIATRGTTYPNPLYSESTRPEGVRNMGRRFQRGLHPRLRIPAIRFQVPPYPEDTSSKPLHFPQLRNQNIG